MLRPCIGRGDERNIHFGLQCGRELYLGLFRRLVESLSCERIGANIDATLPFELKCEPVDDLLVNVFTAEVRITISRAYFDHIITHFEH